MSQSTESENELSDSLKSSRPVTLSLTSSSSTLKRSSSGESHTSDCDVATSSIQSQGSQRATGDDEADTPPSGSPEESSSDDDMIEYAMKRQKKASQLLGELAKRDRNYTGLEVVPPGATTPEDIATAVFSPMGGSPSDKPSLWNLGSATPTPEESLLSFMGGFVRMRSHQDKDGINQSKPKRSSKPPDVIPTSVAANMTDSSNVWTLRIEDGKLYLFHNGTRAENPVPGVSIENDSLTFEHPPIAKPIYHKDEVVEITEGEVSAKVVTHDEERDAGALITRFPITNKSPQCNARLVYSEAAYLALDYSEDPENPKLHGLNEEELIQQLEGMQQMGKDVTNTGFAALVNIRFVTIGGLFALFFNGDKYRYYLNIEDKKVTIQKIPQNTIPTPTHDTTWQDHLNFSNEEHNPRNDYTDAPVRNHGDSPASNHGDDPTSNHGDTYKYSTPLSGNISAMEITPELIPNGTHAAINRSHAATNGCHSATNGTVDKLKVGPEKETMEKLLDLKTAEVQ